MFTGIVQTVGSIQAIEMHQDGRSIAIQTADDFLTDTAIGDSICVQGACLTATEVNNDKFLVDVSKETMACTTLGDKNKGDAVNLESALTLASKLGGHLVTGHVDGLGRVVEINSGPESTELAIETPQLLSKYIARKGSICIDGVSLTVNEVSANKFRVTIIPHTLANTTLRDCVIDAKVNLEVDLVARYLERLQSHVS